MQIPDTPQGRAAALAKLMGWTNISGGYRGPTKPTHFELLDSFLLVCRCEELHTDTCKGCGLNWSPESDWNDLHEIEEWALRTIPHPYLKSLESILSATRIIAEKWPYDRTDAWQDIVFEILLDSRRATQRQIVESILTAAEKRNA